jgi:germination protein M
MSAVKSVAVLLLSLALALPAAGCGGDDEAVPAGTVPAAAAEEETGTTAPAATDADTTEPDAMGADTTEADPGDETTSGTRLYEVWFADDDALYPTWMEGRATNAVATEAVELLLDPQAGVPGTAIPDGTRLLGIDIADGVATVDLSSEFELGGGSHSMLMRLAQVVYTVTQFPTVQSVRFHLDGEPVDVFSGEGIVLDKPVTRKDYEDLLPAILVESPRWHERVTSPIEITGTANVFEANVTVRLVGEQGHELERTFVTATCGTGCRGTFELSLPYKVQRAQEASLVLSDDDADGDGHPQHEVSIPVLLEP